MFIIHCEQLKVDLYEKKRLGTFSGLWIWGLVFLKINCRPGSGGCQRVSWWSPTCVTVVADALPGGHQLDSGTH